MHKSLRLRHFSAPEVLIRYLDTYLLTAKDTGDEAVY
jgi:hypothetical protein